MMKMEIWKDVVGFEGLYQVSSIGRVRSLDRITRNGSSSFIKKGRILKPNDDGHGYVFVWLYKGQNRERKKIHRLVACSFIDNHGNKPEIDHINAIKSDNRVEI